MCPVARLYRTFFAKLQYDLLHTGKSLYPRGDLIRIGQQIHLHRRLSYVWRRRRPGRAARTRRRHAVVFVHTFTVWVLNFRLLRTFLCKKIDDFSIAPLLCQRVGILITPADCVNIGVLGEKQFDDLFVIVLHSEHQRRHPTLFGGVEIGPALYKQFDNFCAAVARRSVKRRVEHQPVLFIDIHSFVQTLLDAVDVTIDGGLVY